MARDAALGRPFWTLVGSTGLSNLADGVSKIALPLMALRFTRSPTLIAAVEVVRSLPWLVLSLQVGALVDRLDRRRTMVAANVARAAFMTLPAVALAAGRGTLALLYVAAAGAGVAEVFYDTSAQSILPSLVPRDRLERANGRLVGVEMGAQELAGPPLGGLLVAVSVAGAFTASAALWVAAVVALLAVHGTFRPAPARLRTTIRADIREGFAFLATRPALRTMAAMVGMMNLAGSAAFTMWVLFAVGPDSALGLSEPRFGLLFAGMAAGGLVGGLLAERVQRRLGGARTMTLAIASVVVYVVAPALTTSVALLAVILFVGGASLMLWNITTVSFRQRVTPDHLLGRVNSTYRLVAWGTRPLGAALGGLLGQWLGIRSVFLLMGLLSAAAFLPNRRITEDTFRDSLPAGASR